ncbi:MAG: thioesterase family protein [Rhodospirillales bacterium]
MTSFTDLIGSITQQGSAHVPEDWRQGRTTYGGLSAALCVAGALRAVEGLPPLRAAQFAFVGPAAGELRIEATVLRRGKSSVFVGVDLLGDDGLATRAILSFGAARPSTLNYRALPAPDAPLPADEKPLFPDARRPQFMTHFEIRRAGGHALVSNAAEPDLLLWIRHNDPGARHGLAGLIALADALPPAAMTMFSAPAPISTITWSIDMLEPELEASGDPEGWHLMQSRGDHVRDGYSTQHMVLWNAKGVAVLAARQTVAVFV